MKATHFIFSKLLQAPFKNKSYTNSNAWIMTTGAITLKM